MDSSYRHSPSDKPQPPVYNGDYLETPHPVGRPPSSAHELTPSLHAAPRLPSSGFEGHSFEFMRDFSAPSPGGGGGGSFGGHRFPFPYGFYPSVPPPPFGCPSPGLFPSMTPPAPLGSYSSRGAFPTGSQFSSMTAQYDPDPGQRRPQHGYEGGPPLGRPPQGTVEDPDHSPVRAEDGSALQRRQDRLWLRRFLQDRDQPTRTSQARQRSGCVPDLKAALHRAAQLVSRIEESCGTLRSSVDDEGVWMASYLQALEVQRELQRELQDVLSALHRLDGWKERLSRVAKRRARLRRAGTRRQVEESLREERISEKEAAIDKWRTEQIRLVEEKKTEQELKRAADAVLCEVRKKQADVKRMQDVLRSLEKLRRLRKEAASRKGIATEAECEETFGRRLQQLRSVMKRRTAVYSAEENTLKVMLEGEQEQERRREREKRVKKEREKLLQKKQRIDGMLFGDELPAGPGLQPFRDLYTQAERSLQALLQIRRDWDMFVVPMDHPDGSPVPQDWVLPDPPSGQNWASALQTCPTE